MPKEEYLAMRKACRERVEKNFTNNHMIEGYKKVYEKVLTNYHSKKPSTNRGFLNKLGF
jgi:hypothetical protein